jgi:pyruvate formate lyase activating enzyme
MALRGAAEATSLNDMGQCVHCGMESRLVSACLGLCVSCVRADSERVAPRIREAHRRCREKFGLPPEPPHAATGVRCGLCVNDCALAEGQTGYCGLRSNRGGRLEGATREDGRVSWYRDPLPTNCVADWVCPAGSPAGFPRYSYSPGPEYGYSNLAVFYHGCSFDCLFCQNWHHREGVRGHKGRSPADLAAAVDERTACICYFGGDPSPQLPHALEASRIARERNSGRVLRICWETNGSMAPRLLERAIAVSLESGGCIKFDLKAWSEPLNIALCGVSNQRTLANFERVARRCAERPDPPLLVASTLLVPGYVDETEVTPIARFIASLDPGIPYALLAFGPQFCMTDLPLTSRRHADSALRAARSAGLRRVRLGNRRLLGDAY